MSVVAYSKFPASVKSPTRHENRAAVIVADGVCRIAVPAGPKGVTQVEEFDVVAVATVARVTTITAADGTEWAIGRGDGCGCSSPLRSWYRDQLGTPTRQGT